MLVLAYSGAMNIPRSGEVTYATEVGYVAGEIRGVWADKFVQPSGHLIQVSLRGDRRARSSDGSDRWMHRIMSSSSASWFQQSPKDTYEEQDKSGGGTGLGFNNTLFNTTAVHVRCWSLV